MYECTHLSKRQQSMCSTDKNARLSAAMISELEEQGMRLHREKAEYAERLQTEATALRAQIDRNEVRRSLF